MKKGMKAIKKMRNLKQFKGVYKWGLIISVVVHGLVILAVALPSGDEVVGHKKGDRKIEIKVVDYVDLPPPPSIMPTNTFPINTNGEGDTGEIPLPVPDSDAERDTIPDIINNNLNPIGDENIVVDPDNLYNDPSEHPIFIPYEERPVFIKQVQPDYPTIGREGEIEGTVGLMVYVGTDGKVKNVVVTQPMDLDTFNREAVESAYECTFTPATMSGQPVGVWISLPMNFVLH